MTGECFVRAGTEPSILCGAVMPSLGGAFRVGTGEKLIFEACEYKDSFLSFNPTVAAISNIEAEHLDYFRDIGHIRRSFEQYARGAERVVMNVDCPEAAELYRRLGGKAIACSLNGENAEITARNALESRGFWEFSLVYNGQDCGRVRLSVPGRHNVSNALVAAGVSLSEGLAPEYVVSALCDFRGISRRMEYKGSLNGALIYDDYAHHPTEIKATLAAVRAMGFRKVICAFQPHTYSRTALLFSDFTTAFEDADTVIFTDIYAAREENVYGVSSRQLAEAVKNGIYAPTDSDVERIFREMAEEGVALLTMGASGR